MTLVPRALLLLSLAGLPAAALPDLAFVRDGSLHLVATAGEPVRLVSGAVADPTWTPDGCQLVFTRHHQTIEVIDLESRRVRKIAGGFGPSDDWGMGVRALAVHPTAPVLWFARGRTIRQGAATMIETALWRVGLDGSGLRKVVDLQVIDRHFATRVRPVERMVWEPGGQTVRLAIEPDHGWSVGRGVYPWCYDLNGRELDGPDRADREDDPPAASLPVLHPRLGLTAWPLAPLEPETRKQLRLDLLDRTGAVSTSFAESAGTGDYNQRIVWPTFAPAGTVVAYVVVGDEDRETVVVRDWTSGQVLRTIPNASTPAFRPQA